MIGLLPRSLAGCLGRIAGIAAVLLAPALPASASTPEFLEPERAFPVSARALDASTVELRFDIADGYYLYRDSLRFAAQDTVLGDAQVPRGKTKFDETFRKTVEAHRGVLIVNLPVKSAPPRFDLEVLSQGCADAGLCYAPMKRVASVSLAAFGGDSGAVFAGDLAAVRPAASAAPPEAARAVDDAGHAERLLRSGRFWGIVGAFAAIGVLLSLTPCVLPMLPMLSSIIAGADGIPSRRRSMLLAGSCSLGMALVYVALGVASGLAGEGLAPSLQSPWLLAGFAAVLIGLAVSMLCGVDLRLPQRWQSRLAAGSKRLPAGHVAGMFAMGSLSALMLSPCVSEPLAGTLVFVSQTGDAWLGGAALFAMAAGMSVPLLLVGASAGAWLPRSGPWMLHIRRLFGLMLLGAALWMLSPLLVMAVQMLLWGALLAVGGLMLLWPTPRPLARGPRWAVRVLGAGTVLLGAVQWLGADSGAGDPLRPLAHLLGGNVPPAAPAFHPVRSVAELEQRLRSTDRPVMLDFHADWCGSCKEMQRDTFAEAEVRRRLGGALLLKADVTAGTDAHRALLRRFQLFGPPGIVFFDRHGSELAGLRVVGFQEAARFAKTLDAAGL